MEGRLSVTTQRATLASPWLTVEEAADYLRVTPRWIRRKVSDRELVGHKVGKFRRFRVEELDAFARAGRVESASR